MGGEYRFLEVGRKLNSPLGFPHLGGEVRTLFVMTNVEMCGEW